MTQFYYDLYTTKSPNKFDIATYLQDVLPKMKITAEDRDLLDFDITEREVHSLISALYNNNGFASEFYKTYRHLLIPNLLMCNQNFERWTIAIFLETIKYNHYLEIQQGLYVAGLLSPNYPTKSGCQNLHFNLGQ